jgi:hypothetical protein
MGPGSHREENMKGKREGSKSLRCDPMQFTLLRNVLEGFGSDFLKKEEEYDFVCGC